MDNKTTEQPYKELFVMEPTEDGSPDCYFVCNVCERSVDDGPCPDHAPLNVPGLQLVECDASPRHPHVWMVDSEAYGPPCMSCLYDAQKEKLDYLQRCRHTWVRRTRLFRRLARYAYALGIVVGYGTSLGGGQYGHHACTHGFRWRGRRPYVLGWPTWKWSCLLGERHWPGVFVGLNSCAKCLPCPECGSSTSCFDDWCENSGGAR